MPEAFADWSEGPARREKDFHLAALEKGEIDHTSHIEQLVEQKRFAEIAEYLQTLEDRSAIQFGIDFIVDGDRAGVLLRLAEHDSVAGSLALCECRRTEDGARLWQRKVEDGSIARLLAERKLEVVEILDRSRDIDLVRELEPHLDPAVAVELCNAIMEPAKSQWSRILVMESEVRDSLARTQEKAAELLSKQPLELWKDSFLRRAAIGDLTAATALDRAFQADPNYANGHQTRRTIPDEAIIAFHREARAIAEQHGLTNDEIKLLKRDARELDSLRSDIRRHVETLPGDPENVGMAMLTGDTRLIFGEHAADVRQSLQSRPDLLARYEEALTRQPEVEIAKRKT